MATPSGREDSSSQTPGPGKQGSGAWVELLDHPERLEAEVPDHVEESVMWKKAQEFFQTCDSEGKGFIARTDMQVRGGPHLLLHMGYLAGVTSFQKRGPHLCSGGVVSMYCVGSLVSVCSFHAQPFPAVGLFAFPGSVTP